MVLGESYFGRESLEMAEVEVRVIKPKMEMQQISMNLLEKG